MLKCSHGLAFELKCSECFSEALKKEMRRTGELPNTTAWENPVPVAITPAPRLFAVQMFE